MIFLNIYVFDYREEFRRNPFSWDQLLEQVENKENEDKKVRLH
jgi:hypothetical protein